MRKIGMDPNIQCFPIILSAFSVLGHERAQGRNISASTCKKRKNATRRKRKMKEIKCSVEKVVMRSSVTETKRLFRHA